MFDAAESPLFEEFTLCNLLKHNCLNNHAQPPTLPAVAPLAAWRGLPMTHELAEQLFIGWLGVEQRLQGLPGEPLPWSWKVVCGQNPAYDLFGAFRLVSLFLSLICLLKQKKIVC